MVVVRLACKSGGTATTSTAKIEETKAQSEEEHERDYDCCCDLAAGWSGVVASICCLQRAVWIV
jgi:hypothetical protein